MTVEDIFNTLSQQNMITARESTPPPVRPSPGQSIKFPKGRKNGIARRHLLRTQTNDSKVDVPKGPFVVPTHYKIRWDRDKVVEYLKAWEAKGYFKIKPDKLQWSPYILTRSELKAEEKKEVVEKGADAGSNGKEVDAPERTGPSLADIGDSKRTSVASTAQSSTPSGMPYKSPLGLFDDEITDDLPVFGIPENEKARSRSASRSPARTRSRSRSETRSKPLSIEGRGSNGVVQQENGEVAQGSDEMQAQNSPVEVKQIPTRPVRGRQSKASKMAMAMPQQEPTSPPEPRITRRRGVAPASENARTQAVDGDKALAARLALEERNRGRNLRSRASTSGEQKPISSTLPTPRTVSSRKRRRVDSSPEGARTSSSVDVSPSVFPVAFVNGKHRKAKVNGKDAVIVGDVVPITVSLVEDGVEEERRVGKLEELGNVDNECEDVKPEEIGTPLTSLTSRQSLPRDDTDGVNHRFINGKRKTGTSMSDGVIDVDADADGEYEEDIEGELEMCNN